MAAIAAAVLRATGSSNCLPLTPRGVDRLLHQEAMLLRGHAGHFGIEPAQALKREHQQAFVPDQWRELLGQCLARQRPEAGAAAAAEDDWLDPWLIANPRQ